MHYTGYKEADSSTDIFISIISGWAKNGNFFPFSKFKLIKSSCGTESFLRN